MMTWTDNGLAGGECQGGTTIRAADWHGSLVDTAPDRPWSLVGEQRPRQQVYYICVMNWSSAARLLDVFMRHRAQRGRAKDDFPLSAMAKHTGTKSPAPIDAGSDDQQTMSSFARGQPPLSVRRFGSSMNRRRDSYLATIPGSMAQATWTGFTCRSRRRSI